MTPSHTTSNSEQEDNAAMSDVKTWLLEDDPETTPVVQNSAHDAMRRSRSANDAILVALLGAWVSETEPTIHVGSDGLIAGIGSPDAVVLWAPGAYARNTRSLSDILTGPVFGTWSHGFHPIKRATP